MVWRRLSFHIPETTYLVERRTPDVSTNVACCDSDENGPLVPPDVLTFAREQLQFEPDEMQTQLLERPIRRLLLNCTRQWGKSTITAIVALHRAWTTPEC